MKPVNEFPKQKIKFLFTDIDDTITDNGMLKAEAYAALWRLHDAGIGVIPVTGRPAGWCEMIARFWPVQGVIGENGGLYFRYDNKKMHRHFFVSEEARQENQKKLKKIEKEILSNVPGAAIASDQFCRVLDLAVDFAEDVEPLPKTEVQHIVQIFEKHGAIAKVSSIHVNGWFGDYDKLTMCKEFCKRELSIDLTERNHEFAFSGDSPNDEPMFSFFKNSFAVANISKFIAELKFKPAYVAQKEGGEGFVEIANALLK